MKWLFLSAVFLLLPFGGVLAQVDLQDENTRATQPPPSFIEPGSGVPVVKTGGCTDDLGRSISCESAGSKQCTDDLGRPIACGSAGSKSCTDDLGRPTTCPVKPVAESSKTAGGQSVSIENPLKAKSITQFFTSIIQVILIFATPLVVLFIILAGFKYVVARGNPEKIKEANNALLFAVIGGLLILGAFAILAVIQGTVDAFLK